MVCTNVSCMLRGGYDDPRTTSRRSWASRPARPPPTARSRIVEEECLAACANAPMMICGNDYFLDLTPQKVDTILDDLRKRWRERQQAGARQRHALRRRTPARDEGLGSRTDGPGRTPSDSRSSPRTSAWPTATSCPSTRSAAAAQAFKKALTMQPAALVDEVKKSNLRGRGGAGFPTGHEVVVHPQGRQARSTWSSTPTSPSRAPARTASCSPTTRTCCSRAC